MPIRLLTLRQFAARHEAFTVAGLRWLRYRSSGPSPNGYSSAFKRVAGRVLIDESEFFRIVDEQNGGRA